MARPKKIVDGKELYNIPDMAAKIDKYIDECCAKVIIPVLKECCLLYGWSYDYIMELRQIPKDRPETPMQQSQREQLSQSVKNLLGWREVMLERGGCNGSIDRTMAVFCLKQLGWTDTLQTQNDTHIHISLTEWDDGD